MKLFTSTLIKCLNEPKSLQKIEILMEYFKTEIKKNIPIAFHLLIGENFGRFCSAKLLREWCAERLNMPVWLIDESYEALGDNSETISLCFTGKQSKKNHSLHALYRQMIVKKNLSIEEKKDWVISCWDDMSADNIYTFNKMLGGGIRIGASKKNVLKALSKVVNIDVNTLEYRLLGDWVPNESCFEALINPQDNTEAGVRPYPFFLASPFTGSVSDTILDINDWIIEPKWDGIRAQIVHRKNGVALWSRGNDLISNQFPEIIAAVDQIPYGVYDGELLAWKDHSPLPFFELQKRLNRKNVTSKIVGDIPCVMKLYDCIEYNGEDIRNLPIFKRRKYLSQLRDPFMKSESLSIKSLSELNAYVQNARDNEIEGVIIKHHSSIYKSGRIRGDWWKLKVDPLFLDVVIMYAQKGRGIRSGLFTDYTFGVWDNEILVPIGKAYSGLTNDEIKQVNKIIKQHLTDKFGPVRGVSPCVVLEIAFDGIQPSSRHKSGLALRFPRIHRLRLDKPVNEANTLKDALSLCKA